jgi:RNA polymerase sigma-32 factor
MRGSLDPFPERPVMTMGSVFESGSLRAYRADLSSFVPLDRARERDLANRFREGDKRAGEQIVLSCLPFVISIALEYRRWGVPLEDIVQQGNLGLLRAAAKFDPDKECRLATYAAYWIRAEIREYVVRACRVVRLGTTKNERRALRAYRTTGETDPEKLAAMSGLTPERASLLLPVLASKEMSLDAQSGDLPPAMDRLASQDTSPEEDFSKEEVRGHATEAVSAALEGLSPREQLIVRRRMMSEEPTTLQEIGGLLGVSKERVRQLEERAKAKLRGALFQMHEEALGF